MVTYKVYSAEFDSFIKTALEQINDLRPAFIQIGREFYKANKAIFKLKGPGQYADFTGPRIAQTWKNPGRPDKRVRDGNLTAYQHAKQKATGLPKGYLYWSFPVNSKALWPTKPTVKPWTSSPRIRSRSERPLVTRPFTSSAPKNADATNPFFIDPRQRFWAGSPVFSRRNKAWKMAIERYVLRSLGIKITEAETWVKVDVEVVFTKSRSLYQDEVEWCDRRDQRRERWLRDSQIDVDAWVEDRLTKKSSTTIRACSLSSMIFSLWSKAIRFQRTSWWSSISSSVSVLTS